MVMEQEWPGIPILFFFLFSYYKLESRSCLPKENRTIAIVNGLEGYQTLQDAFREIFEDINKMIALKKLQYITKKSTLNFFLGGYYKSILLMMGRKGATCNYTYAWLDVRMPQTQTGIYLNPCLIQALTTQAKNLSQAPLCSNIWGPTLTVTMHNNTTPGAKCTKLIDGKYR